MASTSPKSRSAARSQPSAKGKRAELAPSGARHFVFHSCLVEQGGKILTVTVPGAGLQWRGARVDKKGHATWSKLAPLAAKEIDVACAGRAQTRQDGAPYPKGARVEGPKIVFTGAASFGRVLAGESATFVVQADVTGITGLPKGTAWSGFESIELTGASIELAEGGPGSGPHQPYP